MLNESSRMINAVPRTDRDGHQHPVLDYAHSERRKIGVHPGRSAFEGRDQ